VGALVHFHQSFNRGNLKLLYYKLDQTTNSIYSKAEDQQNGFKVVSFSLFLQSKAIANELFLNRLSHERIILSLSSGALNPFFETDVT
jgi:CRISPR/Cas system endoribonuclease Cas6 (RAMP superfamily)